MLKSLEGYIEPGSEADRLVRDIDFGRLPRHIAVIMDGNGRWAGRHGKTRIEGHKAGSHSVRETVECCARLGIEVLSLFAFSTENWKRPAREVHRLWKLLRDYLRKEDNVLVDNDLKLVVIGRRDGIPGPVLHELERVESLTRDNGRMTVALALNYGARTEIIDAVRRILAEAPDAADLNEDTFSRYLYTAGLPDPDLLIRTSGECRVSNFLLWQIAYAEMWITPVLWPDFRKHHLIQAVLDYQKRERRFGDIGEAGSP